jgi:6,7-dimethyl-8-ribityllumazine synthase
MLESINRIAPNLDGRGLKIGIVMSRFSENICDGLRDACLRELAVLGVSAADVQLASVPGALEIPLVLQTMAKSGRFDALVAIGAVIRGETYHFELVANESGSGVSRVALDCAIPVANAVLTTEDDDQALVRMEEKGRDAARVAVEMARLQQALR